MPIQGLTEDEENEILEEVDRMDEAKPESPVLTAVEVADLLRVSYRTIITMAKAGEIPAFVIAGQWRFSRSAILKWIDDISNELYDPVMRTI
mgnify:CR=1 FL=1